MTSRALVILAIIAVLLQSAGQLVILINFKINQAYIASVLCENKDKPEMKCNGKCHLNKQLKANEQQQQQLPPQVKLKEVVLYAEEATESSCQSHTDSPGKQISFSDLFLLQGFLHAIFQPPEAI